MGQVMHVTIEVPYNDGGYEISRNYQLGDDLEVTFDEPNRYNPTKVNAKLVGLSLHETGTKA